MQQTSLDLAAATDKDREDDSLRAYRSELADFIRCFDFVVQEQVPVRDPDNPLRRYKPGLRCIDLLATHKQDGYRIAYAINCKTPSRQAKTRLLAADADEAWIITRNNGAAYRIK